MQFKAFHKIKKDDKKKKINDKKEIHNKSKKSKNNKGLVEFNKVYILSPTINIANKQCYIFEPLNPDIDYSINADKFINNFDNDEILLKRPKIKVQLNEVNDQNKNYVSMDKKRNNTLKNIKTKKNTPIKQKQKNIILNYSNIDNQNNDYTNSIQNSFESSREKFFQKNKNKSYSNYFKKSYEKRHKLDGKNNLKPMNVNKTINEHCNNSKKLYKKKTGNYISDKHSMNHIPINNSNSLNKEVNTINHLNIIDNNTHQAECFEKENSLTQSKYLTHSSKFYEKSEETKIKIIKSYKRNNIYNSIFSPQNNRLQNTYQKKLIRSSSRIDNNTLTKNIDNNSSMSKDKTNIKHLFRLHNYKYTSPDNYSSSNNLSIFGLLNTIKEDENNQDKDNYNYMSTKICDKKLYNNLYYNNKEKEDINVPTEQNDQNVTCTDNNISTAYSFYNNKRNNNNNVNINQNMCSLNKLEHKLKNLITSINYKAKDITDDNKNNQNKTIILCEVDKKGKVNYKVKEMKNSVEKIVKDNSVLKNRKKRNEFSPKNKKTGLISLYVKKNQGTVLRKYKNKSRIGFYSNNDNDN